MKVNIYYGGRGLIEDPTIYVMNILTEVLNEIRVEVTKYNLYEEKNAINMLPKTLKDVDGVILATPLEWMGIGGYMQLFLDACWLYGDKQKISSTYMMPVVISSTYGEREAELTLIKAWEMLGGTPCSGLCAYVEDHVEFETNRDYRSLIEKKAETLYRTINQKIKSLPTSDLAVRQNILRNNSIELTPQESEQLSMYVSDDKYVKKQKEDIEELAQIFKEMLGEPENEEMAAEDKIQEIQEESKEKYVEEQKTAHIVNIERKEKKEEKTEDSLIKTFQTTFMPQEDFAASYIIQFSDLNQCFIIEVNGIDLRCYYGEKREGDVMAKTKYEIMEKIISGEISFQKAFMSGQLTAKGNFKVLRTFDIIFPFNLTE